MPPSKPLEAQPVTVAEAVRLLREKTGFRWTNGHLFKTVAYRQMVLGALTPGDSESPPSYVDLTPSAVQTLVFSGGSKRRFLEGPGVSSAYGHPITKSLIIDSKAVRIPAQTLQGILVLWLESSSGASGIYDQPPWMYAYFRARKMEAA